MAEEKITLLRIAGWGVHLLTASAAVVGFYTIIAITQHQYRLAFLLMGVAIFIDAIDGTLARKARVKTTIPEIDGALLDNLVDYINYVFTPCFFAWTYTPLLPDSLRGFTIGCVLLASAYQFTQTNAKTDDCYFTGFPSYWNFVFLYLLLFRFSPEVNVAIILALVAMVFVPIRYLYLSRMHHAIPNRNFRLLMLLGACVFGIACITLIYNYPSTSPLFLAYSLCYCLVYFILSLYLSRR